MALRVFGTLCFGLNEAAMCSKVSPTPKAEALAGLKTSRRRPARAG